MISVNHRENEYVMFKLIHIKNNVSSNLAEILFILCQFYRILYKVLLGRVQATEIWTARRNCGLLQHW